MHKGTRTYGIVPPEAISWPLSALTRRIICLVILVLSTSVLRAQNAIQIENAKPGTDAWQATNLADDESPGNYTNVIEGYASLTSVNRGGQITFFVNVATPGDSFTMDIYRMGWYGGLGGRAVLSLGPLPGVQQPMPTPDPTTGLIECNWNPTYVLNLNSTTDPVSNWVSGVYLVLLTDTTSTLQRYIVFVVRDDARASNYYLQSAVDTYQAYNNWGGKSLYAFDSDPVTGPATKVSFNRPYQIDYGYDGAGDFTTGWEYDMVRFLEREGYDVTYGTDIDAHESPSLLLNHKGILIVGHSEYWSKAMRNNIIAARDAGVGLGILAGNVCYWQVRFEPSPLNSAADRTMVGYKDFSTLFTAPGPDPYYAACIGMGVTKDTSKCPLVTVQWREDPVNLPENAFEGVMWVNAPVDGDIVVTNTSNWIFNTTGLHDNDTLPGLLGYEVDGRDDSNGLTPAGTLTLGVSPFTTTDTMTPGVSNMTVYAAGSGATVFAAGSIQFAWGLDDYSQVLAEEPSLVSFGAQQMIRNLLAKFIGDQPPLASVGGPYPGATFQSIQFDGTASSDPDGTIVAYQWDFGDGTAATGSFPTHAYAHSGTYTITLIVTDDEGSRNAATTSATITDLPLVGLSTSTLMFANQMVGTTSASQPVTLNNTGAVSLSIAGIVASGDYSQTNNCGSAVAAGNHCTITVKFIPTAVGSRPGAITITDNNLGMNGSVQSVTLTGIGIAPVAGAFPLGLGFNNQLVSTASATQPTVLRNTGTAPLTVASIVASGNYSQTNNCGGAVAAGGNCTITVKFTPTATGSRPGAITITDNSNAIAGSIQTVSLSGMGVSTVAGVQPASVNFGNNLVGSTTPSMAVTITNSGPALLTLTSFAASGDFTVIGTGTTCSTSSSMAVNGTCQIAVKFSPTAGGARRSALVITDNAGGGPLTATLTGVGISASLSPASLIFTNQSVGIASSPQVITLTNLGSIPMNIWQVGFLGANASDFSVATNTCPSTLGGGANCMIGVSFTPGAAGARTASFLVSDDGGGNPQAVGLTGTGMAAPIDPSSISLSFGEQIVGTSSPPQSVLFSNTGKTTMTISKIEVSGSGHSEFHLAQTCGASLRAGQSCTLQITFAPHTEGSRIATITIVDNAPGGMRQIGLQGVGVRP